MKLQRRSVTIKIENLLIIDSKQFGRELVQTVNARNVWKWLNASSRFNDWIKRRIEDGQFDENVDYVSVTQKKVTDKINNLSTDVIEYHVTLDMAKHLCMLERNEKGKQAREYFIRCENEQRNKKVVYNPFNLQDLGNDMLQVDVSVRRSQKLNRTRLMYVLARKLCCGRQWIQRLTNEIYKTLLNCPHATARNFREHMNLPQVSAIYLTRDQLEGHIQILVSGIEQAMLILYSANQTITFGELREYALEQAKISHKQLLRIVQQPPSSLVFEHEYNVVPILPYRERQMQQSQAA